MKTTTVKTNTRKFFHSKGFSLVELMIAMTLGLFLIAGVGTVYISSKQTYKLQGQTAELDENARAALRVLKQHIAHAGYASTSGVVIDNYIIPDGLTISGATCSDGSSNISNAGIIDQTADRTGVVGDTIGLIFMADSSLATDCNGGELPAECLPPEAPGFSSRLIYNSLSVANSSIENSLGTRVPTLRCAGSRNGQRQSLAQGVESIQFLYGVDSDTDGSVENYWNATDVATNAAWNKIISVQVGLLMRSVEPAFDTARTEKFRVLDRTITRNDRYKRGVYTTTIRLKNVARRM
ncbi:MAG: PilW family protein [Thiolinea sp.]